MDFWLNYMKKQKEAASCSCVTVWVCLDKNLNWKPAL